MTAQIRVATEMDLENLASLITIFRDHLAQQTPHKAAILASLRKLLAEDDVEFLVADVGDGITAAYTQTRYYYSLWSTGFEAQIEDVFVIPTERKKGIGARLVQRVVCRARERGCRLIALNTNECNALALHLYTKAGFVAERSRWKGGRQLWLELPL